jgi:hypothetical protein
MYDLGHGVPQDYAEAVRWYLKAAEQGVELAQTYLGGMYDQGRGVPQDYAEAATWFRRAADRGVALAQFVLGTMYEEGTAGSQDYVQAHMWVNLAASHASGDVQKNYAEYRDRLARKMTAQQVAEAQRLAREWKRKGDGQL